MLNQLFRDINCKLGIIYQKFLLLSTRKFYFARWKYWNLTVQFGHVINERLNPLKVTRYSWASFEHVPSDIPAPLSGSKKMWPARNLSIDLPLLIPYCCCVSWNIKRGKFPQVVIVDLNLSHYTWAINKINSNFLHLKTIKNQNI